MDKCRIARSPLTHFGWGALQKLREELKNYEGCRILFVVDPVLTSLGVAEEILSSFDGNYNFEVYDDLIPEPTLNTADKIVSFARKDDYAAVIGIGGGSALDMAKLAAVLSQNPGEVKDYLNLTGTRTLAKKGIPKILIPTTAGTGTEVTNISVLALQQTKDVIAHDFLIADVAIVDPQLTVTLPQKVTAATGVDALTHAIESLLSVNASSYSDALATKAIQLIGRSLEKATNNGKDKHARTDMAFGSYLAGLAFFNAGVGAVHALAYPVGGQFHISHGESNAVLLPYVIDYIKQNCLEKVGLILEALGGSVGLSEKQNAAVCVQKIHSIIKNINISGNLKELSIPESALTLLAKDGIKQERLLARCPMQLTEDDILRIYQSAY